MNTRFVLFLSRRVLRGKAGTARYLRGAVLGIAVSLVPLIVVMEVSTGMIEGITARLLEVGTYHLQVLLAPDIAEPALDGLAAAIGRVPDVVAVVPERIGTAMIVSARGASGVSIRFVPPDLFQRDKGFRGLVAIREGEAGLNQTESLLLSSALASSVGVSAGDTVSVLTTWGENLSGPPKLTPVRVSGIYDTGYQELDASLAYAPLSLAKRILSPHAARAVIGVKVRDPFGDLTAIARSIARVVGEDTRVSTWREIEYARLSSFRTTKALLLFIMALIVVVACVNVSSSILMILFERRHDVGILKSVGASPRSLSLSFLLAGFATGLAGTLSGIAAGLLVAVNINEVITGLEWTVNRIVALASIVERTLVPSAQPFGAFTLFNSAYYLKSIPVRIIGTEVIATAIGALLLSGLAAYLPAARASRTRPLEILRKL
jgi:lipoprotein-releasing system permease protein